MRNPRFLAAAAMLMVLLGGLFYMLMRPVPEAVAPTENTEEIAGPVSEIPPAVETKVPEPETFEDEPPAMASADLVLRGTVRDAETDAPIAGAEVLIEVRNAEALRTETDAAGAFELTIAEDSIIRARSATARAEGYSLNRKQLSTLGDVEPGAELFVTFSLHPGTSIAGTVRDGATGAGIEGVSIRVFDARASLGDAARERRRESNATDESGAFVLPNLSTGAYRVVADGRELGYLAGDNAIRVVNIETDGPQSGVDFTLQRGGVVAGRVVDANGRPVSDVEAMLMPADMMQQAMQNMDRMIYFEPQRSDEADGGGQFEIPGVDFDTQYRLMAQAEGYAPVSSEPFRLTRAQPRNEIQLVITVGSTISGRAVHEDNTPAANRELMLNPRMSDLLAGVLTGMETTETDETGAFTFEHIAAGDYSILPENIFASMADGSGDFNPLDIFQEQDQVSVDGVAAVSGLVVVVPKETMGTGVIRGTVLLASGEAAAGVRIRATPMDSVGGQKTAATDAEGAFAIEELKGASYDLSVKGDNGSAALSGVLPGAEVLLRLNPPLRVAGQVVDESGRAVPDGRVQFEPVAAIEDSSFDMTSFMQSFVGSSNSGVRTDDAGHFVFENIDAGQYVFKAKSSSRGTGVTQAITLYEGQPLTNLIIRLEQGAVVSGVVVDGAGNALEGATVSLIASASGSPNEAIMQFLPAAMQEKGGTATSDSSGSFRMVNVPAGTYAATASYQGMATTRLEDVTVESKRDVGNLRIVVTRGGCVEGVARVGNEAKAGVMVQLAGALGQHIAMTDASGRFEICSITPGTYMATAVDMQRMQAGDMSGASTRSIVVEITDGDRLALNFEPPSGGTSVSGVLSGNLGNMTQVFLRVEGGPLIEDVDVFDMGEQVEMMRYMAGQTIVGPDGTFDFGSVEPGEYILEVLTIDFDMTDIGDMMNADRTPQIRREIEVEEDKPVFLELSLR